MVTSPINILFVGEDDLLNNYTSLFEEAYPDIANAFNFLTIHPDELNAYSLSNVDCTVHYAVLCFNLSERTLSYQRVQKLNRVLDYTSYEVFNYTSCGVFILGMELDKCTVYPKQYRKQQANYAGFRGYVERVGLISRHSYDKHMIAPALTPARDCTAYATHKDREWSRVLGQYVVDSTETGTLLHDIYARVAHNKNTTNSQINSYMTDPRKDDAIFNSYVFAINVGDCALSELETLTQRVNELCGLLNVAYKNDIPLPSDVVSDLCVLVTNIRARTLDVRNTCCHIKDASKKNKNN